MKNQTDICVKLDKRQEEYIKTVKEMQIKTNVKEVIFWQTLSNFKAVRRIRFLSVEYKCPRPQEQPFCK